MLPRALPNSADRVSGTQSKDTKPTPVFIVDEKECKAKALPAWTSDELWAWGQICQHLNVDFDEREANDTVDDKVGRDSPKHDELYHETLKIVRARNTRDPEKLAKDGSRKLSGEFLAAIFGKPELRPHTWNVPLTFFGFNTDRFVIDPAALKSLDIRNAHVGHSRSGTRPLTVV